MKTLSIRVLLLICTLNTPLAQALEVVASIKPIQLIAQEITRGVTQPQRLLEPGASPHNYQLRPSDIQRLQRADLVFWVGPEFEQFLKKPLANLPADIRVVPLQPDTRSHNAERDALEPQGHDDHEHHSDPHIWLSPVAAIGLAETIATTLQRADPGNSTAYQQNLQRFRAQQQLRDRAISTQLTPVIKQGYYVFHDGYGQFEQRYGLNHIGAFTLSPNRHPGARQLATIRRHLEEKGATCVFSEPQFRPRLIEAITEGLNIRSGQLDPMGAGANSFDQFMEKLSDSFYRCLSGPAQKNAH